MALTYYIRSWDPRSTYPTNPQEGDICYTITLDQTWAPVGGVKKDNILKEEIYQNGAWVEQGGGGGPTLTTLYDGDYESMPGPGFALCTLTMDTTIETEPAELSVIYGGAEYTLPKIEGIAGYGEMNGKTPSFENYPVAINLTGDVGYDTILLFTEQAESGSIIVSADLGGGGGGESDYSTCTVTLAGNLYVDKPMFAIPILIERKNGICLESAVNVYQESSEDYTVLLYKGQAVAMNQQTTSSVSGAVTKAYSAGDNWYTYTITGDCTITIGSDK